MSDSNRNSLITIVNHSNEPPLMYPEMNCDYELHKKLRNLAIFRNMNKHFCACFCGVPGSGKTSLLEAILATEEYFNQVFHRIYVFCPEQSTKSMTGSILEELPDNQIYHDLNLANLEEVLADVDRLASMKNPPRNMLIIFDDVQKDLKGECQRRLCSMAANRRHSHLSACFLIQNYINCPVDIRKLFSDLFCFDLSATEFDNVYSEHGKFYKDIWQQTLRYYLWRVKQENDKKNAGDDYEKVFLYLNTTSKEVFVNLQEIKFDHMLEPEQEIEEVEEPKKKKKKESHN